MSQPNQCNAIQIDTAKFQLIALHEGTVNRIYPIAIGKDETPTPVGDWTIIRKKKDWGHAFGPRWLELNVPWGVYGIHGTNHPELIGAKASHGCIRMFNQHVIELFEITELGTPVEILGPLPQVPLQHELRFGGKGKEVLVLQLTLRKAGFYQGTADGRFEIQTENAVKAFQIENGLSPTGKVTEKERRIFALT